MSVTINFTFGEIKIELFCDFAPRTCENFLALAGSGYYNNTKIHRNIKGFMVQMVSYIYNNVCVCPADF